MSTHERETRVDAAMLRGGYAPMREDEENVSLVTLVRNAMAGRWIWAALVAIVLGGGFGAAGYLLSEPQFETTGYIQVVPESDVLLRAIPENRIADTDAAMEAELRYLRNPRVTQRAPLMDPRDIRSVLELEEGDAPARSLVQMGWNDPVENERILRDDVQIRIRPRSTIIEVTYASPDQAASYAVVQSLLASYEEYRGSLLDTNIRAKKGDLETIRTNVQRELQTLRERLRELRGRSVLRGDAEATLALRLEELEVLEGQLRELRQRAEEAGDPDWESWFGEDAPVRDSAELAAADGPASGEPGEDSGGGEDAPGDLELSLEDIPAPSESDLDRFDPSLSRLRGERDLARSELDRMQQRYAAEDHPRLRSARRSLEAAREAFEIARADAEMRWREQQLELRRQADGLGPMLAGDLETPDGRRRFGVFAIERREELLTQIDEITSIQAQIEGLGRDIEEKALQATEVGRRLRDLEVEGMREDSFDPIRVFPATRPLNPSSDRRTKLAAVGLAGGFGVSFGGFFLLGLLDRRAYAAVQFERTATPQQRYAFLGAVPDMDRKPDPDVDPHALAASCVHLVRNRIDAVRPREESLSIAVGSPQQGDGKTSFAMALGHSYARSGCRTVVVDCDLVGEGLTIAGRLDDHPGFRDVLRSGSVNGEVVAGGSENLWLLPAGRDLTVGPESIRAREMRSLVEGLRGTFDVVILDGGPMPGSIESIPVTASVDGVVIVTKRGRQKAQLDACVEALEDAGARVFGVVLNRARPSDCERMVSASAVSLPVAEGRRRRLAAMADGGMKLSTALRPGEADAATVGATGEPGKET